MWVIWNDLAIRYPVNDNDFSKSRLSRYRVFVFCIRWSWHDFYFTYVSLFNSLFARGFKCVIRTRNWIDVFERLQHSNRLQLLHFISVLQKSTTTKLISINWTLFILKNSFKKMMFHSEPISIHIVACIKALFIIINACHTLKLQKKKTYHHLQHHPKMEILILFE